MNFQLVIDSPIWFSVLCYYDFQIDIMQMCVVEMHERPGSPLFHLENYIEGHYVKYNSNSGFVQDHDEDARCTPQVSVVIISILTSIFHLRLLQNLCIFA